jgi:pantoate--beta-alanine ligase
MIDARKLRRTMPVTPLEFNKMDELKSVLKKDRSSGKSVALVPTMGYLHEGHLELMRRAKQLADICVVSIFVNPTQFGPNEDLDRYPRNLERDRALAQSVGVDYLFVPEAAEMYPDGYSTFVDVENITNCLCGKSRPGHFRGVATVVLKFFNIVQPDFALFGEKDYQQLAVIRRMTEDLNLGINIVGVPIVREPDGLAMSSRNSYLSAEERQAALILSRALTLAKTLIAGKGTDVSKLRGKLEGLIKTEPLVQVEYLEIMDPVTLLPIDSEVPDQVKSAQNDLHDGNAVELPAPAEILIAIAARVGNTRLIDNAVIGNV